jgi:hypothetical protein
LACERPGELSRLLYAGDKACAVETEPGILLTAYDPDFVCAMETEARISQRCQNALAELAK